MATVYWLAAVTGESPAAAASAPQRRAISLRGRRIRARESV